MLPKNLNFREQESNKLMEVTLVCVDTPFLSFLTLIYHCAMLGTAHASTKSWCRGTDLTQLTVWMMFSLFVWLCNPAFELPYRPSNKLIDWLIDCYAVSCVKNSLLAKQSHFWLWEAAFIALTLLAGRQLLLWTFYDFSTGHLIKRKLTFFWNQVQHPACKNWVMRCWCGYLSGARCWLFAYGPADATVSPNPIISCLI